MTKDPDIIPIIKSEGEVIIQKGDVFHPELFVDVIYPFDHEIIFDRSFDTDKLGDQKIEFTVEYADKRINGSFILKVKEREKEVVTIEKVIEKVVEVPSVDKEENKEKMIETDDPDREVISDQGEEVVIEKVIEPIEEKPYFNAPGDISIAKDSSLQSLTRLLSNVDTNVQVSIDYSGVNLSEVGTYPVYYYTDIGEFTINVTVY